jgi:transposase
VGQTTYPARRRGEHRYAAFTKDSPEYNLLFHRKLREYGEENFTFEILEEIDTTNTDYVDGREQFWIEQKESYVKTGKGYNLTLGGQSKGRHKTLTPEQFQEVIDLLENTSLTYKQINEKTGRSLGSIVDINRGSLVGCPQRSYPIRKPRNISQETKDIIKELLETTSMTRQEIADMMDVSLSTVKRIKASMKNS